MKFSFGMFSFRNMGVYEEREVDGYQCDASALIALMDHRQAFKRHQRILFFFSLAMQKKTLSLLISALNEVV